MCTVFSLNYFYYILITFRISKYPSPQQLRIVLCANCWYTHVHFYMIAILIKPIEIWSAVHVWPSTKADNEFNFFLKFVFKWKRRNFYMKHLKSRSKDTEQHLTACILWLIWDDIEIICTRHVYMILNGWPRGWN